MSELSTMDLEWSPDMGGKEGLSALGYGRVKQLSGVPERWVPEKNPEKWVKEEFGTYLDTYIYLFEDRAIKLRYDFMDKWKGTKYEYMTVREMTSCIKRCQELAEGDTDQMHQIHNGDCADPVFVVKLTGILSPEDIELYERKFKKQLPGRVIVTDGRVEDIREVTGMRPRDAIVTVHHESREFDGFSVDGNTPNWRYVHETEHVPAKVWPVAMGDSLVVEFEGGRLGTAKLYNIQVAREDE